MNRFAFFLFCAAFFALTLVAPPTEAAGTKNLGKFGYWEAYQTGDATAPVCYMSLRAKPPIPKGSKLKRGEVVFMITHRPAEGSFDVISYAAGTKFKPSSDVELTADGKIFSLFTDGSTAWARDPATDKAIALAMRAAQSVTISGIAAVGGPFADTISMKGSALAYKAIGEACGATAAKK